MSDFKITTTLPSFSDEDIAHLPRRCREQVRTVDKALRAVHGLLIPVVEIADTPQTYPPLPRDVRVTLHQTIPALPVEISRVHAELRAAVSRSAAG